MKKAEYIKKYGIVAYEKMLQQSREWNRINLEKTKPSKRKWAAKNPEIIKTNHQIWSEANPDKVKLRHWETNRKGGKYYDKRYRYRMIGIPHERELVRGRHGYKYRPYKQIVAPDSQIHHEWVGNTANYRGVALVETDRHRHGFVDVIQILDGEITLLTERR